MHKYFLANWARWGEVFSFTLCHVGGLLHWLQATFYVLWTQFWVPCLRPILQMQHQLQMPVLIPLFWSPPISSISWCFRSLSLSGWGFALQTLWSVALEHHCCPLSCSPRTPQISSTTQRAATCRNSRLTLQVFGTLGIDRLEYRCLVEDLGYMMQIEWSAAEHPKTKEMVMDFRRTASPLQIVSRGTLWRWSGPTST